MSTTVPLSGTHAIVGMQGGTNGKDYQVIVLMALSTGTLEYRLEEDYLVQVRAVSYLRPFLERGDTMSTSFLTAADRERLNRFPAQIPDEDLSAFFLLSEADQQAIHQHREAHTRLGFALQLCALRYLGFAPDDLGTAPAVAVAYLAQQPASWTRFLF